MGNLDLLLGTARYNPFFAPIKLQRVTCRKMQRDECLSRTGPGALQLTNSETLSAIDGVDGSRFRHRNVPCWVS